MTSITISHKRSLTLAPADLADALNQFGITDGDYYLEFTENTIYLHWVASQEQVQDYIDDLKECLDVQLYNHWIDTYGSYESGHTILLPEEDYFPCRYILETI